MPRLDFTVRDKNRNRRPADQRAITNGGNLIQLALNTVGCTGYWAAVPIVHERWKSDRKFGVRAINEGTRQIIVRTRPGDNGSVWEWALSGPNTLSLSELHEIFTKLSKFDVKSGFYETVEHEPEEAPVVIPEPEPVFIEPEPLMHTHNGVVIKITEEKPSAAPIPPATPQLVTMVGKLAKVAQRVQERERIIHELEQKRTVEEAAAEKAMSELQTTETLLRQYYEERDADQEAAAVQHLLSALT